MSENGIPQSNPALDAAMANATGDSITDIVQAMKDTLHSGQFNTAPAEASVPAAGQFKFERVVRWAESTGKHPLVLRANSIEELNELERQVTS